MAYIKAKDRVGTTINNLKILDYKREEGETYFYIECLLCGNKKWMRLTSVIGGKTISCGCYNKTSKTEDLTGRVFGKLKVIESIGKQENGRIYWKCQCSCGALVNVSGHNLKNNNVQSCGCLKKDLSVKKAEKMAQLVLEGCVDGTNVRNLKNKKRRTNTSGIKGVCWDKARNKWLAQIMFKGKNYNLGRYDKIEDAAIAREKAEEKIFGDFLEWYAENYREQWEKIKGKGEEK